jgi:hypothetical protein
MLFTVVEKHARDSRALRIRLNARDSWEQGCCPRGPSVVVHPPASPRDVFAGQPGGQQYREAVDGGIPFGGRHRDNSCREQPDRVRPESPTARA